MRLDTARFELHESDEVCDLTRETEKAKKERNRREKTESSILENRGGINLVFVVFLWVVKYTIYRL